MMAEIQKAGTQAGGVSSRLRTLVESRWFRHGITAVILVNAVVLGVLTYPLPGDAPIWLERLDQIIVYVFVAELLLKFAAWRLDFFRSGWNWFDLFVVGVSLVPAAESLAVLRALRVLRLFRLFSVMPQMRAVVEALGKAIPGMGAIMAVLLLIFYVASVMAAKMFGEADPEQFGDLGASAFTLFQVMTLESWSTAVAREIMATPGYGWAWIFFVLFIVATSFAVLNLFIAVIVDSLQSKHFDAEKASQEEAHDDREKLLSEMAALRADVAALRAELSQRGGAAARSEDGSVISAKSADNSE